MLQGQCSQVSSTEGGQEICLGLFYLEAELDGKQDNFFVHIFISILCGFFSLLFYQLPLLRRADGNNPAQTKGFEDSSIKYYYPLHKLFLANMHYLTAYPLSLNALLYISELKMNKTDALS